VGTAGYLAACENESTQLNHILQKIFSTSIRIAWQGKKKDYERPEIVLRPSIQSRLTWTMQQNRGRRG
jgi:hypothetical protein